MDKLTPTAQRAAAAAIETDVAAAFPAQAGNVTVIAFSASKRIGVERAETLLAYWLGEGEAPGRGGDRGSKKERASRSRGVTRGPK